MRAKPAVGHRSHRARPQSFRTSGSYTGLAPCADPYLNVTATQAPAIHAGCLPLECSPRMCLYVGSADGARQPGQRRRDACGAGWLLHVDYGHASAVTQQSRGGVPSIGPGRHQRQGVGEQHRVIPSSPFGLSKDLFVREPGCIGLDEDDVVGAPAPRLRRAARSMSELRSTPTTRPDGPTCSSSIGKLSPVPQPTSSTRPPGRSRRAGISRSSSSTVERFGR